MVFGGHSNKSKLGCTSTKMSRSYGSEYEYVWLVGSCPVRSRRIRPTFQRCLLPQPSGWWWRQLWTNGRTLLNYIRTSIYIYRHIYFITWIRNLSDDSGCGVSRNNTIHIYKYNSNYFKTSQIIKPSITCSR
jgi:hypothetical protein